MFFDEDVYSDDLGDGIEDYSEEFVDDVDDVDDREDFFWQDIDREDHHLHAMDGCVFDMGLKQEPPCRKRSFSGQPEAHCVNDVGVMDDDDDRDELSIVLPRREPRGKKRLHNEKATASVARQVTEMRCNADHSCAYRLADMLSHHPDVQLVVTQATTNVNAFCQSRNACISAHRKRGQRVKPQLHVLVPMEESEQEVQEAMDAWRRTGQQGSLKFACGIWNTVSKAPQLGVVFCSLKSISDATRLAASCWVPMPAWTSLAVDAKTAAFCAFCGMMVARDPQRQRQHEQTCIQQFCPRGDLALAKGTPWHTLPYPSHHELTGFSGVGCMRLGEHQFFFGHWRNGKPWFGRSQRWPLHIHEWEAYICSKKKESGTDEPPATHTGLWEKGRPHQLKKKAAFSACTKRTVLSPWVLNDGLFSAICVQSFLRKFPFDRYGNINNHPQLVFLMVREVYEQSRWTEGSPLRDKGLCIVLKSLLEKGLLLSATWEEDDGPAAGPPKESPLSKAIAHACDSGILKSGFNALQVILHLPESTQEGLLNVIEKHASEHDEKLPPTLRAVRFFRDLHDAACGAVASTRNLRIKRLLEQFQADVSPFDNKPSFRYLKDGDNPLHTACRKGNESDYQATLMRFRLDNDQVLSKFINLPDKKGRTLLQLALCSSSEDAEKLAGRLLDIPNIDVLVTDAKENTPLHEAVKRNRVILARLIEHCKDQHLDWTKHCQSLRQLAGTNKRVLRMLKPVTKEGKQENRLVLPGNFKAIRQVVKAEYSMHRTKQTVAVKSGDPKINSISREATALTKLHHASIVKLIEHRVDPHVLVLEWCQGSLDKQSVCKAFVQGLADDADALRQLASQLFSALAHVHNEDLAHRDISPHNILLRPNNSICLSDFGSALDPDWSVLEPELKPEYCPPDAKHATALRDWQAVDAFAAGKTLLKLQSDLRAVGYDGPRPWLQPLFENLCNKLVAQDPQHRPAFSQALEHFFVQPKLRIIVSFHELLQSVKKPHAPDQTASGRGADKQDKKGGKSKQPKNQPRQPDTLPIAERFEDLVRRRTPRQVAWDEVMHDMPDSARTKKGMEKQGLPLHAGIITYIRHLLSHPDEMARKAGQQQQPAASCTATADAARPSVPSGPPADNTRASTPAPTAAPAGAAASRPAPSATPACTHTPATAAATASSPAGSDSNPTAEQVLLKLLDRVPYLLPCAFEFLFQPTGGKQAKKIWVEQRPFFSPLV
eukprot:m.478832 g.478832  ORF g.478832 m.478832 type:complete len:1228 (-) comp21242_c0_seq1:62-3745(-)